MELLKYPRPAGDTGIGFHWFPGLNHYQQKDLEIFLPILKDMGVSWLKVLSEPVKPIPENFIRGLIEAGIEPIVRVLTRHIEPINQSDLRQLCQTYARWGVHYIHVYNEPNLASEWATWEPKGLVERFMNYFIPCMETMYAVEGIVPIFTPLSPGGHYRDTEFIREAFDIFNEQGKSYLYDKMAVCINNYAANKPLDWGEGGQEVWPHTQPLYTPPGSQDSNGFHQFEWYNEIISERVGHSLPLLSSESGVILNNYEEPHYPPVDEQTHARRSVEMSRLVMESLVPPYYFNTCFWVLATDEGHPFAAHRWFTAKGEAVLPRTVAAMRALPKHPRPLTSTFSFPDTLRVLMPDGRVQEMNLEEYVKGVVPAAMVSGCPLEALKAQAVAARTYAVANRQHLDQGADVCTAGHCQPWQSQRQPDTDQAVEETRGEVILYKLRPIHALHFSHCEGHTRPSEEVFPQTFPYCRGVACPATFPKTEGHGVGLCRKGAIALAGGGSSYKEIIAHYYAGVTISSKSAPPPPPLEQSIIRGRVVEESGAAVSGARLILRRGTWQTEQVSSAEGKFEFRNLLAGTFTLEVAETGVVKRDIQTDGQNVVEVEMVIPSQPSWEMGVERRKGLRLLIGKMPRPGIPVTIIDPWGNKVSTVSGSKPEYGPGGFETPLWSNGLYTISFLDQTFKVEIQNDTVIATFTERLGEKRARLVSRWLPRAQAEGCLARIESLPECQGLFQMEEE
ncbi:MAG: SpoIID/LytB domain-containing protein [Anaerolineae bacterium]